MLPAVYQAVSYGADFIKAFYHARFFIRQGLQHKADRFLMIPHGSFCNLLFSSRRSINQPASFDSNSFTQSLCNQLFTFRIYQLELQG